MKYETLLTRYKNLGYVVKGYDTQEMEIESIINWLWDNYKIFIGVFYMKYDFPKHNVRRGFKSHTYYEVGEGIISDFIGAKSFDSPYDAKFDGLRTSYGGIKSQIQIFNYSIDK